jgi:hypothetical protein
MTGMLKVTARWDGFVGAPGYSNFFFVPDDPNASFDAGAAASAVAVEGFFNAIKHLLPPAANVTVQSDVPVVEDSTGSITAFHSAGTRTAIVGTAASAPYSAASGAVVTWRAAGVRRGRRVRGRTFVVPLANVAYEANGSLVAGAITSFGTAAGAILNAAGGVSFGIWTRPTPVLGPDGKPTGEDLSDGEWFDCMNATVPDKVAVLRSRRD